MKRYLGKNMPLILGLVIVLLKILIIDIDPPEWDIAYYHPIDELYYNMVAMNLFEHNELFPTTHYGGWGVPLFTNALSYLCLLVFGENYLGFRLSSIIFALISVIFFYLTLKDCTKNKRIQTIGVLILVLNYPFTLSNLFVEPTIARIAGLNISLFLAIRWFNSKVERKYLLFLTILLTLLWLIIYPTNAFILLGLFFCACFKNLKLFQERQYLNILTEIVLPMFIGVLIGIICYYSLNQVIFGELGIERSNPYKSRVAINPIRIIANCIHVYRANIFLFNPILLLLTLLGLKNIIKMKDNNMIVIVLFLLSFLLQTMFINDYPERKLIILLPFVALISVYSLKYMSTKLYVILFGALILAIYGILVTRYNVNFHIVSWAIFLIYFISLLVVKKKSTLFKILLLPILLSLFNTFKFTLLSMTKNYKEAALSLSIEEDINYIGGWSKAFSLYNNNKMLLNPYLYYGKKDDLSNMVKSIAKSNDVIDYTIGYSKDSLNYKKMGFEKYRLLIPKHKAVRKYDDIFIYKEIEK